MDKTVNKETITEFISQIDQKITSHNQRINDIRNGMVQLQKELENLAKMVISERGEISGHQKVLRMIDGSGKDKK